MLFDLHSETSAQLAKEQAARQKIAKTRNVVRALQIAGYALMLLAALELLYSRPKGWGWWLLGVVIEFCRIGINPLTGGLALCGWCRFPRHGSRHELQYLVAGRRRAVGVFGPDRRDPVAGAVRQVDRLSQTRQSDECGGGQGGRVERHTLEQHRRVHDPLGVEG